MHASHASRRLPPQQPAKSYGYYAKTILSYGCGLMAVYGVWTAANEISRVRVGTIFSVVVGLTGWIFFRWLNKKKVLEEAQPANSNEIGILKAKVAALEESTKYLSGLIEKQGTEIFRLRNILTWNEGTLIIPPDPTISTRSQDDLGLSSGNSSGPHTRRLSFNATGYDTKQNSFLAPRLSLGEDGASIRVSPQAAQSLKGPASSHAARLHQGRTSTQGRSGGRGRTDGKKSKA